MVRGLAVLTTVLYPLTACGGSEDAAESPPSETPRAEAAAVGSPEDVQIVEVRVEGDAYLFTPENVQAGKPVRLVFDPDGLPGCSRDVTLPGFDIAKVISAGDATIDFTPVAQGSVDVVCSMSMYRGTLVVE